VLSIDRTARVDVSAPPERCLEILSDVARYPSWASLIASAEVIEDRVKLRAQVLGLPVEMQCSLATRPDGAVLQRIPYDDRDDERYVADWRVGPSASGAEVTLHVTASLDAPGPARVLRGRVERLLVDGLVNDLARAVGSSV
jgi:hypothetical protein